MQAMGEVKPLPSYPGVSLLRTKLPCVLELEVTVFTEQCTRSCAQPCSRLIFISNS
jgi:hypothetical protein